LIMLYRIVLIGINFVRLQLVTLIAYTLIEIQKILCQIKGKLGLWA